MTKDINNNELTSKVNSAEEALEESQTRPSTLNEFIGQKRIKESLQVYLSSAKERAKSLDHVLFSGPPGLGKTTLSAIVAKYLGVNFKVTSGPMLSKAGDLAAILTNIQEREVLFIDEIHRLSPTVEEILYPAMEDYRLDIIVGEGPAARTLKINLPPFTLIGATTRMSLIAKPLKERFGIHLTLSFYEEDELMQVVKRGAQIHNVNITDEGALLLAKRSRGTPRIALRLTRRVIDFAVFENATLIDERIVNIATEKMGIDKEGLDYEDLKYLNVIINHYNGGPVGIETIAASMSEDKQSVSEVIEPFLLQKGFIERRPQGRVATNKARIHLGLPPVYINDKKDIIAKSTRQNNINLFSEQLNNQNKNDRKE